jgi:hypothetical protein
VTVILLLILIAVIATALALLGVVALALRKTDPADRPEILRATGDMLAGLRGRSTPDDVEVPGQGREPARRAAPVPRARRP